MKSKLQIDTLIRVSTVHGYARRGKQHPVYKVWKSMTRRCRDRKGKDFKNYAGRGISVCERWKTFQNFFEDMGSTYKKGLMIERKDNNKGYSKENCKWATRTEQNRNKRNVPKITFNGLTLTLPEWSERLGGNAELVSIRLRRGWPLDRALSTPLVPQSVGLSKRWAA